MKGKLQRREFLLAASCAGLTMAWQPASRHSSAILDSSASRDTHGTNGADALRQQLLASETDPYRRAALNGDVKTVEEFLAHDPALLYARDVNGQSVYLLAAYANQQAVTGLFESKGLVLDVYEAAAAGKVDRFNQLLRP